MSSISVFKSNSSYVEEEQKKEVLKKELQKFFAPEFLNRIDEIIIFNQLKKEDIEKIVDIEIQKLISRLTSLKYKFTYDKSLVELISEIGFDESYGARPLKRALQDKVEDYISEEVLKGEISEDKEYELYVEDNEVKIKEKKKRKKKGE